MADDRSFLIKTIRKDKYVVRLKEVCDDVGASTPVTRLLKEGASLHSDRTSRDLFKHAMSPTKLYEARLKDMSHRARLTEIRVSLTKQESMLKVSLSEVKKHIVSRYADDLKPVASTVDARKAYIDRTLNFAVTLLDTIEAAIQEIDLYIRDLDQAAFGFRDATDLVRLMTERKDQIV